MDVVAVPEAGAANALPVAAMAEPLRRRPVGGRPAIAAQQCDGIAFDQTAVGPGAGSVAHVELEERHLTDVPLTRVSRSASASFTAALSTPSLRAASPALPATPPRVRQRDVVSFGQGDAHDQSEDRFAMVPTTGPGTAASVETADPTTYFANRSSAHACRPERPVARRPSPIGLHRSHGRSTRRAAASPSRGGSLLGPLEPPIRAARRSSSSWKRMVSASRSATKLVGQPPQLLADSLSLASGRRRPDHDFATMAPGTRDSVDRPGIRRIRRRPDAAPIGSAP